MSTSSINVIMDRITKATEHSQIAVFSTETSGADKTLNAVFAGTHYTQKILAMGDPRFVGSYDNTMEPFNVRGELLDAVNAVQLNNGSACRQ